MSYGSLHFAARDGDIDLVTRLLRDGGNVHETDDWAGWTPLVWAAHGGHVNCIEALLAAGANVHGPSPFATPLIVAVMQEEHDAVVALLRAGADPNAGMLQPLFCAMTGETTAALLDAGAEADARDRDGTTALMAAVKFRSRRLRPVDVARALVNAGADAHGRDRLGRTITEIAQIAERLPSIALLREAGGSVFD